MNYIYRVIDNHSIYNLVVHKSNHADRKMDMALSEGHKDECFPTVHCKQKTVQHTVIFNGIRIESEVHYMYGGTALFPS